MNVREEIVEILDKIENENNIENIHKMISDCFTISKYSDDDDLKFLCFLMLSLRLLELGLNELKEIISELKDYIIEENYVDGILVVKEFITKHVK